MRDRTGVIRRQAVLLAACAAAWLVPSFVFGQSGPAEPAATGTSAMAFWQAPAAPQAVIRGGSIPAGWQPQAVPYHGIGPDGKPLTVYLAPTYVFTYQSGPPVLAIPDGSRTVARAVPGTPAPAWNPAAAGAAPAATVARYAPTPYQFPADSRALSGTPVVPPAGNPAPAAAAPPAAPPPTQWVSSTPPAPVAPAAAPVPAPPPAPVSGDWVTVVPPAVATAALAAGASTAGSPAADASVAASSPQSTVGSTPAQPVSTGLGGPPSSVATPHLWRVVGVQDGDTVTCLDESNQQQKIRLAGIDAPELGQDYGKESREALAAMVFGKTVEVYDQGRDENGRWIARLVVDGVDVNQQMLATGSAWHYTAISSDQTLAALQSQAQAQKVGLWSQPDPIPPWQFRHQGDPT